MLTPATLKAIRAKLDQGDRLLDRDRFARAWDAYRAALALIPDPKHQYGIALEAYTALGEGYFFAAHHDRALRAFREALKAPGGVENPLLHLRIGQAHFERGEFDAAADALTRAYALDGEDVFAGEDEKYLAFLATRIDL